MSDEDTISPHNINTISKRQANWAKEQYQLGDY